VGIAGEIAQDFLRAAEGTLAVDHPLFVPQWRQMGHYWALRMIASVHLTRLSRLNTGVADLPNGKVL
jgi:hypothetical protein